MARINRKSIQDPYQHTNTMHAFTYEVVPQAEGVVIVFKERYRVVPETKEVATKAGRKFNPFGFEVLEEEVKEPKEVRLPMAAPGFGLKSFLNSLTDDLVYNQWFRVKEHKRKEA